MQAFFSGFAWAALLLAALPRRERPSARVVRRRPCRAPRGRLHRGLLVATHCGTGGAASHRFVLPPVVAVGLLAIGLAPLWGGIVMLATVRVALNVLQPVIVEQINRESLNEVRATIASMGTMGISVVGACAKPLDGLVGGSQRARIGVCHRCGGVAIFRRRAAHLGPRFKGRATTPAGRSGR